MSLRSKLLLWVVLPLLAFTTLAAVLVLQPLERRFEERMQAEVQMVARALQRPISRALERNSAGSVRAALQSAFDIGRVYGAYVYDENGAVLASLGDLEGRALPDEALARARHRGRGGYGRIGSELVYSYYIPVWLDGQGSQGLLEITRLKSDIESFIGRLRWQTGLVLGLASGVMTLIVVGGYHAAAGATLRRFYASIQCVEKGELQHRARSGGPRELNVIISAFNSMLDAIERSEASLRAATEKRLELQLELLAAEKLAGVGRIAAGIAHELGTPLGTVSGRVQRMLRSRELEDAHVTELEKISGDVNRMTRIVREVLDFAREEPGRRRPVSSAALASMAERAVREDARARGVSLALHGPERGLMVVVDPARLERALVNLLRNALQASSPGQTVTLSWRGEGPEVLFVVEDEGPGISESARGHLFQPFFTTRGKNGTGLGLAVVDAVVRQHGGRVQTQHRVEGGARFSLHLPSPEDSGESLEGFRIEHA